MRAASRALGATCVALAATCVTACAQAVTLSRTFVTAPECDGPRAGRATRGRTDAAREGAVTRARTLLVHLVGDSTACGVGCGARGPTLASSFAASVSETLGADVEWRALGFKGADVRALRDKLVPAMRDAVGRGDGAGGAAAPHAVVIMCGINDAKRSVVGRTSSAFREELAALVREVREVVGEECVVVLPATPLEAATLFPAPLAWFATRVNDLWDEQKAHVSRVAENVVFVSKPSLESMRERAAKATGRVARSVSLVCRDGVHPNDVGYDAWARHIAEECAPTLGRALARETTK